PSIITLSPYTTLFRSKNNASESKEQDLTFDQAKEQLLEMGKKRGVLIYEEIADKLANFTIESDQMDEFYDELNAEGVDVIGETDDPTMEARSEERRVGRE